jgi:multidrug resistance efflux pump
MAFLQRLDSRVPRLLLAACILAALLAVLAERVLYRTSIEAVVNAPRIAIVAPIEGIVDSVGVTQGEAVADGDVIVRLRRDGWSTSGDAPLATRSALLDARVKILGRELATLSALQDSLAVREQQYRTVTIAQLVAALEAAVAREAEMQLVLEQAQALQKVDGATALDLARATSALATAKAEVTNIESALASARAGVVSGEGGQDVPYSRQRLDQLAIDIARLRAERASLEAERQTMMAGAMSPDDDTSGRVPVRAPSAGLLWMSSIPPGERVLKGTTLATLVDCRRVYLEATVTPRDGDRIDAETPVIVRFAGTSLEVRGTVRSVRGGGLRPEDASAAELALVNRRGDTRVIINLDADAIGQSTANFCQIGRQAKVFFDEQASWRPLQALSALIR